MKAYEALKPYAYRADLARYCLLHEYGGLYADLSYFFVAPVPMPEDKAVVFRGNLVSSPWDTSNGIIYAQPGFKAFECAIKLVMRECEAALLRPDLAVSDRARSCGARRWR